MSLPRGRLPYAEAARELLRSTLLDAASDLLRSRTWADTTMAEIATVAGVSRQTLYKEFGSRQAFALAYILRESERFLSSVEQAIAAHLDDPAAALTAAMATFLTAAAEEPLIRAIVAGDDSDGLLSLVTNQAGPVLTVATDRLGRYLIANWPDADPRSLRLIADNLVRLAISHAASPTAEIAETAAGVSTIFAPYMANVVAESVEAPVGATR
ncbi:MAG TPA: TetR family transcriptional regulator [Pseudonocardiaceae bacterium]|nr:TetR family transcriptional regulator [Pseudonocardiaceae bacterium]